jgi:hypothetical protein
MRYGKAGNWEAGLAEEQSYPRVKLNGDDCWIDKELYYNQEKHTAVREVQGTGFAASGASHGGTEKESNLLISSAAIPIFLKSVRT